MRHAYNMHTASQLTLLNGSSKPTSQDRKVVCVVVKSPSSFRLSVWARRKMGDNTIDVCLPVLNEGNKTETNLIAFEAFLYSTDW